LSSDYFLAWSLLKPESDRKKWERIKRFHSGVEFAAPREMTEKSDGKASDFVLAWSLATADPCRTLITIVQVILFWRGVLETA